MANQKISQLPSATTPLAGTELVAIVQGGQTRRVAARAVSSMGFEVWLDRTLSSQLVYLGESRHQLTPDQIIGAGT